MVRRRAVERRAQREVTAQAIFLGKSKQFRGQALISVAIPVCDDMLGFK
jgi:hypothetical protein